MRAVVCAAAGLIGLGSFGFGCVTSSDLELEMSRLRREVHALRADLDESRAATESLASRVTVLSARASANPVQRRPDAAVDALPVVRLTAESPVTEASGFGAIDDGGPPVLIKLGPEHGTLEKLPVDRDVLKKPDPVLSRPSREGSEVQPDAKGEYQRALAALREENDPRRARSLFEAFKSKNPSGPLNDNAAYWLGECSFAERKYQQAIDELLALVDGHPRSEKVPDALLRVADSWRELGSLDKAADVLRRIVEKHPESEAASRARVTLEAASQRDGR